MPDVSSAVDVVPALDPMRAGVRAQLALRTPHGGYVIPDTLVVRAIRVFQAREQTDRCHALFEVLVERCMPMFRRMAAGLRHRPEWVEDAIADMTMQLWKEVIDPQETFMEQNFGVYLKRLGADQFKHKLRTEGRIFRTNDKGEVTANVARLPFVEERLQHMIDAALADVDIDEDIQVAAGARTK
jgi:DNA-directed RNA polymerase specialized sigma24 family protein